MLVMGQAYLRLSCAKAKQGSAYIEEQEVGGTVQQRVNLTPLIFGSPSNRFCTGPQSWCGVVEQDQQHSCSLASWLGGSAVTQKQHSPSKHLGQCHNHMWHNHINKITVLDSTVIILNAAKRMLKWVLGWKTDLHNFDNVRKVKFFFMCIFHDSSDVLILDFYLMIGFLQRMKELYLGT